MRELVGRLTALDPEASENLKVIGYFDALVEGRASPEVLLRGAAVLGGCGAGFVSERNVMRVDVHGARMPVSEAPEPGRWPEHVIAGVARVWLERDGSLHANDAMILERLAIGMGITLERSAPVSASRKAVEAVIDGAEAPEERMAAALRLRLDPHSLQRVIAQPASAAVGAVRHQAVIATSVGPIRAIITEQGAVVDAQRAGVGVAADIGSLDRSWASAMLALRLTSDREPVLRADALGGIILLAEAADLRGDDHPDAAALERAIGRDSRRLAALEAIVSTDSLRAAAAELGVHHSTMQVRAAELSTALGFDIRDPAGRTRLSLALSLHRLATNRFE